MLKWAISWMCSVVAGTRPWRRATATPPPREVFQVVYVDHELKEHEVEVDDIVELQAALEQIRATGGYPKYVVRSVY